MTGPQAVSCHASSSLGFPVVHSIAHNDYLAQLSVCQLPPVACSMGSKVKHNNWTHAEGGPRDEAVLALCMCPYHHTSSEKLFARSGVRGVQLGLSSIHQSSQTKHVPSSLSIPSPYSNTVH